MKNILLIAFMALLVTVEVNAGKISIIPQPTEIIIKDGEFEISKLTVLNYDQKDKDLVRIAGYLNDHLKKYYKISLQPKVGSTGVIQMKIIKSADIGREGYMMKVDNNGIMITATAPNGIFYGIQSLKQLLPADSSARLLIPFLEIKDNPRFSWRGMHLDVGRHFFPVFCIKEYLDNLAMYKLNTFHWHLTEDQGWRLEIKKYPGLTEISSWRDETVIGQNSTKSFDGIGYGGFYTQDQVREIVKYAADRFITVVPEIEMPGHSSAALAAYPELGCTGGPYKVQKTWGIFNDVFCAGKDQSFKFLEDVLTEVCELFPSTYIHIGGDECPKDSWQKCPLCQQKIKNEGLKNEHELQSYFIKRIEKFLISKNRKLIGWEEILEGGLAPEATVMAWKRTGNSASVAAKEHHSVVRCPATFTYFNYYQVQDITNEPPGYKGYLPLEKVYSFEPVPNDLNKEESKYIIGAQACVWSEFIATTRNLEYTIFPRICAISEVVWSPGEKKDFNDFKIRLETDFHRLKLYGINYCDHPY
jgi:hexosaminidase